MDLRGTSAKRRKWGRFLPHQRANVDQVPLPFVNDMEDTLEVGAPRACSVTVCVRSRFLRAPQRHAAVS